MWNFDYTSISAINTILKENGLCMSKKFGQNFLISDSALSKIADFAEINSTSKIWEVGPGLGALTSKMLATGADVTCFEIDHGFCKILREQAFSDCPNFCLIEGDALKNWQYVYETKGCPDVICANLPYNVGSVFIASLIEQRCIANKMVFTLQSEVVQRICSNIGDDQYSGFSILTSLDYTNKEVLKLKSSNFWPAPNVDSSVVVMTKRPQAQVSEELAKPFIKICRALFSQRRKTVKNNLKALNLSAQQLDQVLENSAIPQNERAEKLTISQINELVKNITSL